VRLKVADSSITEVEVIRANQGDAGGLWGPERLVDYPLSRNLTNSIRIADRDSYYGLIAAAESYWRAFQTNGTEEYHPADLLFDAHRFENGLHTTGQFPDGSFRSAPEGFVRGKRSRSRFLLGLRLLHPGRVGRRSSRRKLLGRPL
jgi:hypothetical protein